MKRGKVTITMPEKGQYKMIYLRNDLEVVIEIKSGDVLAVTAHDWFRMWVAHFEAFIKLESTP